MTVEIQAQLCGAGVPFRVHRHADLGTITGPNDVARALGISIERITKTLFVCDPGGRTARVVLPMTGRLDVAAAGSALGLGRLTVADLSTLNNVLGYPPKGVSPLGVPRVPVAVAHSVLGFPSVLIGAGETGSEIELDPRHLLSLCNAVKLDDH